jgi:tetratricopeptide (TPR) repeat protein
MKLGFPVFFVITLFSSSVSFGQEAFFTSQVEEGIQLFEAGHYEAAAPFFENVETDEANYYQAAIFLKAKREPSQLEQYLLADPSIPWSNRAHLDLAYYYMVKPDFRKSIDHFEDLRYESFSSEEQEELLYKRGYTYYQLDRFDKARESLQEAVYYGGDFAGEAHYHLGLIAYKKQKYNDALSHFREADLSPGLTTYTTPYIAAIYFEQNRYTELIEVLEQRDDSNPGQTSFATALYLGESYYFLRNYSKAATWYSAAQKAGPNKIKPATYFRYGAALEEIGKDEEALQQYKLAGLEDSETGQSAAFRLANIYLQRSNYEYALNAFRQAADMSYNSDIKESSVVQTGKLLMKLKQYDQAISEMQAYLDDYPNGKYYNETVQNIAEAYLNTSDYQKALQHLQSTGLDSRQSRGTFQEVSFQLGTQLYNDQRFEESLKILRQSLEFPVSRDVTRETQFLLAENYSVLGQYEAAIDPYRQALSLTGKRVEQQDINYGLAYAYFNTRDYVNALQYFRDFIARASTGDLRQQDALTRIADCYFVQKDFAKARASFNSLTSSAYADYAYFQLGTIYYLDDDVDTQESVRFFEKVLKDYPGSPYADNAAYQLGKVYFESERFDDAIASYSNLIRRFEESSLTPYGLLERGLSYSNTDRYKQAEEDFTRIINQYTSHPTVEDALLGLQALQNKGHNVRNFDDYLAKVKTSTGSSGKLTSIEFEQAKTFFFNQEYDRAIAALQEFMQQYPESKLKTEVQYYLADSYYRQGSWQKAAEAFTTVAEENSIYKTRALDKKGKSLLNSGNYVMAIETYRQLGNVAQSGRDKFNSMEGLTNAWFAMDNYDSAIYYADQIEMASWKPAIAVHFTNLVKAKSFIALEKPDKATDLLIQVINNANDRYAAEATYLLAQNQYDNQQYRFSTETLFDLIGNYAAYPEWTDRGYLLLIDNYIALEEYLQAQATAKSILENSENEELKEDVRARQQRIAELQSKEVKIESDSLK